MSQKLPLRPIYKWNGSKQVESSRSLGHHSGAGLASWFFTLAAWSRDFSTVFHCTGSHRHVMVSHIDTWWSLSLWWWDMV